MATESPRQSFSRAAGPWRRKLLRVNRNEWLSCHRVACSAEPTNPTDRGGRCPPQAEHLPGAVARPLLAVHAAASPPPPPKMMSSSLLPTTSGGLHVCPSPPRPRRRRFCQVAAAALPPTSGGVGRRSVSLDGVAAWLATTVGRADAAGPLDKYVKRKKLEPLETYVPAVLLTIDQFVDLEKSLEFEKPRYDETRSLLRSGPASSLRINIRAVAQYASSNGQGKAASDAVDECLRALEDLDSLLLHASRNDPSASVETMRSKITVALGALDNLLQTVPSAVLDKGKAIADAYRTPADDYVEENAAELDPGLKQLQDIL